MAVIYSWVSFEYHLGYLGCHYIFSLYLTFTSLYLILTSLYSILTSLYSILTSLYSILTSLNFTLQVTPLLTKIKSHEIIIFHKKNIIRYFCLFNPKTFLIFAQKVQYNTLLDMKIQEVMKLQRKALGITQQDLSDMSEIAISTIKKIESGKGNPSLSTVEKIMDILGMEVKYEIRQTV
mgnify:CR=1 FL=1